MDYNPWGVAKSRTQLSDFHFRWPLPSAVILEPKKIKSANISTFPLSICHEVIGPDAMILVFFSLSNSLVVQWFGICGLDPAVGWV